MESAGYRSFSRAFGSRRASLGAPECPKTTACQVGALPPGTERVVRPYCCHRSQIEQRRDLGKPAHCSNARQLVQSRRKASAALTRRAARSGRYALLFLSWPVGQKARDHFLAFPSLMGGNIGASSTAGPEQRSPMPNFSRNNPAPALQAMTTWSPAMLLAISSCLDVSTGDRKPALEEAA